MTALSSQTSRFNPRTLLFFVAGSLTVILVYVLVGHLPSRQSPATLGASHGDNASKGKGHNVGQIAPESTSPLGTSHGDADSKGSSHNTVGILPPEVKQEEGWYTSPEENPYGREGADVTEMLTPEQVAASNENMKLEHIELQSQMTKDGKWFTTDFVTQDAYNPGFLPHRYKPDTWVMFAQRDKSKDGDDIW